MRRFTVRALTADGESRILIREAKDAEGLALELIGENLTPLRITEQDGSITDLLPTDAGTYCLTIAVTSDCADYTGSSQWVFTIGATSGS